MKVLSSIQNNLSGSFYNDQRNQKMVNSDDETDYMPNNQLMTKADKAQKLLSSNERSTLHMFFGTEMPDDMRLYGKNNIQQIHKGQLLDLRG